MTNKFLPLGKYVSQRMAENTAPIQPVKQEPVGELVLVHRKVLNKLGIDDEVINTVAHTPAQQEPVATEHPLVAYAESYEQIAQSGSSGKVSALAVATDIRQNMIPLTAANVDLSNAATLSASIQPVKQEPIGEVDPYMDFLRINWKDGRHPPKGTKLYAAPVERQWVELTDDELKAALEVHQVGLSVRIGRIAIAAFKEKNT